MDTGAEMLGELLELAKRRNQSDIRDFDHLRERMQEETSGLSQLFSKGASRIAESG